MKPLSDQLACLKRELALRKASYPKWVRERRMQPDKATHEIDCMEAATASIQKLKYLEEVSEEMRKETHAEIK